MVTKMAAKVVTGTGDVGVVPAGKAVAGDFDFFPITIGNQESFSFSCYSAPMCFWKLPSFMGPISRGYPLPVFCPIKFGNFQIMINARQLQLTDTVNFKAYRYGSTLLH
jgi:hypothetical protein